MYGKIFAKMYEGTLYGQWEALVTFQQMIVLCDADGMIDMTAHAIASRTSIPLEIIEKGIRILEAPDEYSRTPDQGGRRIERIDEHRPWGWHLVNHAKYTAMQDADHVREQTRERVRRHREKKAQQELGGVVTQVTDGNEQKRHTDIDTDTTKTLSGGAPDGQSPAAKRREAKAIAERVLAYLNAKAGTKYRETDSHLRLMTGRILVDCATEGEMKAVVDAKVAEWGKDPEKRRYLSPDTLFNATKYAKYAGQLQIGAAAPEKLEVKAYAERADGTRELVVTYPSNGLGAEAAARQILAQHRRRFAEAKAKNIVLDNGRNLATFSLEELQR